ncbi:MAG: beta-galactosidase, partial [Bacillota bacterium]|nr:beta-galactosidase [Bacillota bacterium]
MGVNTIRIGEFIWSSIEPEEGKFDFLLLDLLIETISDFGFKILLGTPTATFPSWVVRKYSDILAVDSKGNQRKYGTRRQYCYNSKTYRKLAKKITEKIVSRYKDKEEIIAIQLDNELGHEGSDFCQCSNCKKGFQEYLNNKYNSIEKLNKVCGNIFWGQAFGTFEEIPIPFGDLLNHNPTLRLEYARFMSKSLVSFADELIGVIKTNKGSSQKIITNLPGGLFNKWFNPNELCKSVDFVSFDNYPIWGGETNNADDAKVAMELDMIRGLKNKKFWVVEQLIGAQGHDYVGWLPRPNQAKLWAMQAHLRGAESIFFFRYKGLNKGEEQFCQGI